MVRVLSRLHTEESLMASTIWDAEEVSALILENCEGAYGRQARIEPRIHPLQALHTSRITEMGTKRLPSMCFTRNLSVARFSLEK